MIKDEDITQVRERINIVDVISDYVSLKKAGRSFKGLCPFHKEKTPSFTVDAERQLFHCFGCDEGGNVFNFLMKIDHIDFVTAVEIVARRVGYSLNYISTPESQKRKKYNDSIYNLNEEALNFYHDYLMKSPQAEIARAYLKNRGYDQKTAKYFKLGYAPSGNLFTKHSLKKGYSIRQLLEAGLITEARSGHLDRFRQRVIFPIADIKGSWIGFGGRVLDKEMQPKYINSPETPVFSKGRNFYALNWAKSSIVNENSSIVVEGYTDVIALQKAGFTNTVATLGTAMTTDHLALLSRFTSRVFLTFDSDEAGSKAAERTIEFAEDANVEIFICVLPEGFDPADFVSQKKPEDFKELLKKAKTLNEFCIDRIVEKNGYSAVKEREKTFAKSFELISKITNEVSRHQYLKYLAEKTVTDIDLLTADFQKVKKTSKKEKQAFSAITAPEQKAEIELLKALLGQPQLISKAKSLITPEDFSVEVHGKLFNMLISGENNNAAELIGKIENEEMRKITSKLLMTPVVFREDGEKYIVEICARLKEFMLKKRILLLKTELEKLNPVKFTKKYDNMFKELVELEAQKREYIKLYQGG